MEINTNIACRVQCKFCPQSLLIDRYSSKNGIDNINYSNPAMMSFETFKTCIDKIPKSIHIIFSGYTEPFLNPGCTRMILYAHDSGYTTQVYSTLVGMSIDDIDQFKHIPFIRFHVHLPDSFLNAKIPVNSNYISVFKKLLTSNISNITGMTMGDTHPKIKELLEHDVRFPEMISRAGNVKIIKNNFKKKLGPLSCQRAIGDRVENKIVDINVLLPNGDVSLCCMDYGLQNILGNLIKSDYHSLFHSETYKKIAEQMNSYDSDIICRNCTEAVSSEEVDKRRKILNDYSNTKLASSLIGLYQDLLQRFPDTVGFHYYYEKISNDKLTLQDIEHQIKQTVEYKFLHPVNLNLKNR